MATLCAQRPPVWMSYPQKWKTGHSTKTLTHYFFFYHYKTYEMKRFKAIFLIYIVFAGLQFIHVFNIIYSCVFHMTFICECHQLVTVSAGFFGPAFKIK